MNKEQLQALNKLVFDYDDGYYHISKDIEKYPRAWCYIVYSFRGPGKTTSALAYCLATGKKFLYMKRTKTDVNLICSEHNDIRDINPMASVNRLAGLDIQPSMIDKEQAFAGFYETIDGEPTGTPFGYCLAFSAIKSFKGMNFDFIDFIIFDEFIPQAGERVSHAEGEMLLSFYMTALRDRPQRGLEPIKVLLLANSEEVSTPVTRTLEVVDKLAETVYSPNPFCYLDDRGILIHHIKPEEVRTNATYKELGIYKAMQGTKWAAKSFDGEFSQNDFSKIGRVSLKGYTCLYQCIYQRKPVYIYINRQGEYYITHSRSTNRVQVYDLDIQGDASCFWYDVVNDIRIAIMDNKVTFEKYSLYDLFYKYKTLFKVF